MFTGSKKMTYSKKVITYYPKKEKKNRRITEK
jgi:hypothetical protein